jgi:predicted acyltransferase
MSTTTPRHAARPVREPVRRRSWPWIAALAVALMAAGYVWSHVVAG